MDAQKSNILVVDDTVENLRLLISILKERGYTVRPANNGKAALLAVDAEHPDLILLDIMMPEMDGYEVCDRLKTNPSTREIPIIFISAMGEVFDKVKAFSLGGVDYVTKPFQNEEVLARVKTHLELFQLQMELRKKNAQLIEANEEISNLNERLDYLLRRFATKDVTNELLQNGLSLPAKNVAASALFSDIRSFTAITASQSPELTIELLNDYFEYMIAAVASEGGNVVEIFGDGAMCFFGTPVHYPDYSHRAVRAALKIFNGLEQFNQKQKAEGKIEIEVGVGVASGTGVAGYVGTQDRTNYTWVSDAPNLAARLDSLTKQVGKPLLIDAETCSMLDNDILVKDEGQAEIKGFTEPIHYYSVPVRQHLRD